MPLGRCPFGFKNNVHVSNCPTSYTTSLSRACVDAKLKSLRTQFETKFISRCRMGEVLSVATPPSDYNTRANLAKVVGRVPGALGTLLDAVRHLGLEDAGKLGAAIAKVASMLEEGDLPALEDTIGDILEAG